MPRETSHSNSLRRALLATTLTLFAGCPAALATDDRQVYGPDSPHWLQAVGKLVVPGVKFVDGRRSHNREDCSATLVSRGGAQGADTIITAWHCLEYYRDLSKRITFTLLPGTTESLSLEALRLADGGGMHADWAILRLARPVPHARVAALPVHPQRADPGRTITMAGFSRDPGLGRSGEHLTYDPGCRITHQAAASSDSDCAAHKGASGGAVIQLSGDGAAQLAGVVSQGDGAGVSTYVPVGEFRRAIDRYLR